MKKFISLLAAMALSFASVTAFAAGAAENDNIHVKFVADKATVAPGESVTISAFISANGNADVSFDTFASFGLIFDVDNFTYEVTKEGNFLVEDYSEDYGLLWASAEAVDCAANTACVEVKFTAKADAAEATYAFDVSADSVDTGFANGLFAYSPDTDNVTLTGTTVEVKAAVVEEGPKATAGTTTTDGKITEYTFEGTDAIEKVLLFNEKVAGSAITEATRFKVTSGSRSQIFGGDIWAKLGAEGDGEVSVENVVFGLIVTAANNAADFTFEIVK